MILKDAIAAAPIVAILRGVRPDEAVPVTEALHAEGVRAVEVPLNSPAPLESIGLLAQAFAGRMTVGAGTVLTLDQVEAVANVGATLIVSPNTDPAVIARAVALGLDPAPGFATGSEAFAALAAGARHLKLFPAVTYGPGHLRQLKAVLPAEATVWAVGGVGAADLADWWAAGARAFGIGSDIYRPGQTVDETALKARTLVDAARALPRG